MLRLGSIASSNLRGNQNHRSSRSIGSSQTLRRREMNTIDRKMDVRSYATKHQEATPLEMEVVSRMIARPEVLFMDNRYRKRMQLVYELLGRAAIDDALFELSTMINPPRLTPKDYQNYLIINPGAPDPEELAEEEESDDEDEDSSDPTKPITYKPKFKYSEADIKKPYKYVHGSDVKGGAMALKIWLLRAKGDYAEAQELLNAVVKEPLDDTLITSCINQCFEIEKIDVAHHILNRIVPRIQPNDQRGNQIYLPYLAHIEMMQGNQEAGIFHLEKANSFAPDPKIKLALGNAYMQTRQFEKAEKLLRDSQDQSPVHAGALETLALCYSMQGKRDKAIEALKESEKIAKSRQLYEIWIGIAIETKDRESLRKCAFECGQLGADGFAAMAEAFAIGLDNVQRGWDYLAMKFQDTLEEVDDYQDPQNQEKLYILVKAFLQYSSVNLLNSQLQKFFDQVVFVDERLISNPGILNMHRVFTNRTSAHTAKFSVTSVSTSFQDPNLTISRYYDLFASDKEEAIDMVRKLEDKLGYFVIDTNILRREDRPDFQSTGLGFIEIRPATQVTDDMLPPIEEVIPELKVFDLPIPERAKLLEEVDKKVGEQLQELASSSTSSPTSS
eukprot:TRINITY_DN263_c0_g1_i1.p1 TRINITY_DN263_c0_g1~~TRINITY_DN263_c0_g1_i1.p1  ORF type:complete len:616 (-),score=201.49 TRINITY_DN263_c0_g1_i1:178-2025(-)